MKTSYYFKNQFDVPHVFFLVITIFLFSLYQIQIMEALVDLYYRISDSVILWFGSTIVDISTFAEIEKYGQW